MKKTMDIMRRKPIKLLIPFSLAAMCFISLFCISSYAGDELQEYEGFRYIVKDGKAEIVDYGENIKYRNDKDTIVLPDEIDGMKVTGIRADAFRPIEYNCGRVRKVICSDYMSVVDMDSFRSLDGLKTIVLGRHTGKFIAKAEHGGNALKFTSIKVPKGALYLKTVHGALYSKDGRTLYSYPPGRSRKSFRISSKTRTISSYAFFVSHIKRLTIPESIKTVKKNAFLGFDLWGSRVVRVPSSKYKMYKKLFSKYCNDVKLVKYGSRKK